MTSQRIESRRSLLAVSALLLMGAVRLSAQTLVQVPIASEVAGIPTATYNGATAGATCASNAPFIDKYGDGCPALQATVFYTYGSVVDGNNNVIFAEYTPNLVRVVYRGGAAMAAALQAANPDPDRTGKNLPFTPTPGYVYPIAGGGHTLTGTTLYCNGTSGVVALDTVGNGCPAEYAIVTTPRSVAVDRDGNVFVNSTPTGKTGVRVIYVGGTLAAKLISGYNPGVTPQVGYIYALSNTNSTAPSFVDFVTVRDIAVDSQENVYVADNGTATANGTGNQVRRLVAGANAWTTFIPGAAAAPAAADGDGGAYTAATVSGPFDIVIDPNDNIYINDQGNQRIRVVYNSGTLPPVYLQGANGAVVAPVAGSIYTVVGGGASKLSGSQASTLAIGATTNSIGVDQSRNFLFTDSSNILWRVGLNGTAVMLGGSGATTASYTGNPTAGAGNLCNGAAGGPAMTDAYGDGCPATEVLAYKPIGHISFDSAGNLYQADYRVSTAATGIIREYSFNNQFAATTAGKTTAQVLAYTPVVAANTVTPTETLTLNGNTTADFTDAGADLCSVTNSVQTCTYNVAFTPSAVGQRSGSVTLSASGASLITSIVGGVGVGALIALDPVTAASLGSGLSPTGVVIDGVGAVFISDATSNSVLRSTGGGAATSYATGFTNPQQLAVDGAGTLYVADAGNNRIASVSRSGVVTTLLTGTLTAPQGVATDLVGNIYISDTGANRVVEVTTLGSILVKPFTGLKTPRGLFVDAAGNIFVADTGNGRVVELTPANVQTAVATTPATATPVGVVADAAGDLYIADAATGTVQSLPAGGTTATTEVSGLSGVSGLAVDANGNLAVAATGSKSLLTYTRTAVSYAFPDTFIGSTSSLGFTLTNTGNANLTLGSTLNAGSNTTDFVVGGSAAANTCAIGATVAPGAACAETATFQPQVKGALSDTATFPSNAVNSATALLTGMGIQKTGATKVTLAVTPSATPSVGSPFTVTATVGPVGAAGPIKGTVTFTITGGGAAQTITLNQTTETAAASFSQPVGTYTITATYNGDTNYLASSATTSVTVLPAGTSSVVLAFVGSQSPYSVGQPVTVKATITTGNGTATPTGTVNFTVDGQPAGSFPYAATVQTTFTSLSASTHNIIATYSGDGNYVPASATLSVTVAKATAGSTLTATNAIDVTGNTITLTETLTSSVTPTGTVVFSNATGVLGTVILTSTVAGTSVATLVIKNNSLTSYAFSAAYSGDANFAPLLSLVTAASDFLPALATPSVTTLQYNVALDTITINSFENYAGNIQISCTGLPDNSICRATPTPVVVTGNSAIAVQLQIYTCIDPKQYSSRNRPATLFGVRGISLAGLLLVSGFLPLGGGSRRRRLLGSLALSAAAFAFLTAAAGCSSDTRQTTSNITPVGTFAVNVVASDGTTSHSVPLSFVVLPGSPLRP